MERRGIKATIDSHFEKWIEEEQERNRFVGFLDVPDSRPFQPARIAPAT